MARINRTFRIFVSSTFSDLKEERNALQREIFPKLRELCPQHGCRFQAIDLRWGVSEEAGRDQRTMQICIDEIARCQRTTPRPNFIVLLGERYGWRPLPAEIPADEFEDLLRCLPAGPQEHQRRRTLLVRWYRRDDNVVPPVYYLQPRQGAFRGFETWEPIDRDLRASLREAIDRVPLPAEARLKYMASATEQEIIHGALAAADAPQHVLCCFRSIRNVPGDRRARDFLDLDEGGNPDSAARAQLERLKERLRGFLPGHVFDYEAAWTSDGITADHIPRLCEDVLTHLRGVIEEEIAPLEEVDAQYKEIADHDTFGKERAQLFIGRSGILHAIGDYVRGTDRRPLAMFGVSGVGKSALMAQAVEQSRREHRGAEVVVRFIGATPGSSDGRALLESLCRQISSSYGAEESSLPTTYKELVVEFPKRLALAIPERPLLVFLDALDQLSNVDDARDLVWLPADLPAHVRLIVSSLPGECLEALEKKLPRGNLLPLEPMPVEEGRTLMYLSGEAKRLRHRSLADYFMEQPLQTERDGTVIPNRRKVSELPYQCTRSEMWAELEQTLCDLHFIAAKCAAGMTYELVTDYQEALAALPEARVHQQSEQGRQERTTRYVQELMAYAQAWHDARDRHTVDPRANPLPAPSAIPYPAPPPAMAMLAAEDNHDERRESVANLSREDKLAAFLQFIRLEADGLVKFASIPGYCIQQAYNAGAVGPVLTQARTIIEQGSVTYAFLRRSRASESVKARPACLQKWTGNFYNAAMTYDGTLALATHYDGSIWVWDLVTGRCIATLSNAGEDASMATALAITPDGRRADVGRSGAVLQVWDVITQRCVNAVLTYQEGVNAVAVTPDGRLAVSGGADATVRAWDLATGICMDTLVGHQGKVEAVAIAANGRLVLSGGTDGSVRLWDVATGQSAETPHEYHGNVWSIALSPDARTAASVDDWLRGWDVHTGQCLKILAKSLDIDSKVALTPDGQVVVLAAKGSIRLWDVQAGECLRTLEPSVGRVRALALTPDGRWAITAEEFPRRLSVWDLAGGVRERVIEYPYEEPYRMWVSLDARLIVSQGSRLMSSQDLRRPPPPYFYRVWELRSGRCLQTWSIDAASFVSKAARAACADRGATELWYLLLRMNRRKSEWGAGRMPVALPDARVGLDSDDELLQMLDLETGHRLAVIDLLSTIFSFETSRHVVVAGDRFGDVHMLTMLNRSSYVPPTTAVRLYLFDNGEWDRHLTGLCHWCGRRFVPEARIFDAIRSLTTNLDPQQAPCLTLHDETFADPGLLAACPYCHGPLQFDPFVVDNGDRA